MARGPTILFALLAAAVALVLWLGAGLGGDQDRGERAVLAPDAGVEGGALTPEPARPDLVRAPRGSTADASGVEQRAAASAAGTQRADLELSLEVLDAVTGRPVPAFFATVLPVGMHAQGREGAARFTGLAAGRLTVQVEGPEHEPQVVAAELPASGPVQVRLAQRTGLRGIVRFADARPAPDVVLRLEVAQGTTQGTQDNEAAARLAKGGLATATLAKTDADGRYRFAPLPPGSYSVVGEHLGRPFPPLGPFAVTSGMTELPELRLDAGARLEIDVADSNGAPRGDVLLVIVPTAGSVLRRYSGSDGRLVLEPLALGRYTVTLPAQGGQAEQRRELELTLGMHRESFRVDTGTLTGR